MKRLLIVLAFIALLGILESFMGAPDIYGADLITAGQTYADPAPFYHGAQE